MDILAGKPVYLHIANLTAKPESWPKFVFVASASNDLSCIIHAGNDDPYATDIRGQVPTELVSSNSLHAVPYKLEERRDKQVDRPNAVKESDRNNSFNLVTSAQQICCLSSKVCRDAHANLRICGMSPSGSLRWYRTKSSSNNGRTALYNQTRSGPFLRPENFRNRIWEDACQLRYQAGSDRMGITNHLRAKGGWRALLLGRLLETESSNDKGSVRYTADWRIYPLTWQS